MRRNYIILAVLFFAFLSLGVVFSSGFGNITYPINGNFYKSPMDNFTWSLNFGSFTFDNCWYKLDGGSNVVVNCPDNFTSFAPLNDNPHTIILMANIFGVSGEQTVDTTTFTVDTIPPVPAITSPTNTTYDHLITSLDYILTETNKQKCWYSDGIISSTPADCSASGTLTGISSAEGSNTWTLYANDSAGNENSTSVTFWVDSIFPNITLINPATNLAYLSQNYFLVNVSVDEINPTVEPIYFEAQRVALPHEKETATKIADLGGLYGFRYPSLGSKPDGKYVYNITFEDIVSHISKIEGLVILDTIPPTININNPANGALLSGNIAITASSVDTPQAWDISGLQDITIYINGTNFSTCISSPCNYDFDSIAYLAGDYDTNITAKSYDKAGNLNQTTINISIDNTYPNISFVNPTPADGIYNSSQTINVSAYDVHLDSIIIFSNGIPAKTCSGTPAADSYCDLTLNDGNYSIYATANDSLGHVNATENKSILIDTIPPEVIISNITPNPAEYKEQDVVISWTASDTNLIESYINITNSLGNLIQQNASFSLSLSNLPVDIYSATVYARDIANNTNTTTSQFIVNDTLSPEINFAEVLSSGYYNTTKLINISAFDHSPFNISIILNSILVNDTCSGEDATIFCTFLLDADGNYSVNATSFDIYNPASLTETIPEIIIDLTPPIVTIDSLPAYSNTTTVEVSGTYVEANLQSIIVNGISATTNGTDYNATIILPEGNQLINILALDKAGNTGINSTYIIIDTTPPLITDNSEIITNAFYKTTKQISVTITDANLINATLYVNDSVVNSSEFLNNSVTLTHLLEEGNYSYYVEAEDIAGNYINTTSKENIVIDLTPPQIALNSVTTPTNISSQVINGTYSDDYIDRIEVYVNSVNQVNAALDGQNFTASITLSEGNNSISIIAYDLAGNTNISSSSILLDTLSPVITDNSGIASNYYNTTKQINITITDANLVNASLFVNDIMVNSSVFASNITTLAYILNEGNYSYYVKVADIVENINSISTISDIIIDLTLPTITDDYASNGVWVNADKTITLIPNDALSGISLVKYCIGTDCIPNMNLSLPYNLSYITDQTTIVRYRAWDMANNPSAIGEYNISLDKTAPIISSLPDVIKNTLFSPNVSTPNASISGIANNSWTGPAEVGFSAPFGLVTNINATTDGAYIIRLTVTDNANNANYTEFVLTWDTTPPATTDNYGAKDGNWQNSNQTITLTPNCDISGCNWTIYCFGTGCIPNKTYTTPVEIITEGINDFVYSSQDLAGNTQNPSIRTIMIDKTKPSTINNYDGAWHNSVFNIALNASDSTSGIAYINYAYNGTETQTAGDNVNVIIAREGNLTLEYFAVDNAGNIEATNSIIAKLDLTAPSVNAGTDKVTNTQINQDATTSDALSDIASYLWTKEIGAGTITFGTADAEDTTIDSDTDGVYIIRLTVTDNAGNSNYSEINFTWDTTAPVISLISPDNNKPFAFDNNTITFEYNVTDFLNIENCSLIINSEVNQTNITITKDITQDFSIALEPEQKYSWKVLCIDPAGNTGTSEERSTTILSNVSFSGNSTDLSNEADISNVSSFFVETTYALINFTESIDFSSGTDWSACINISWNRISIDSSSCPQFKKKANIILYNLSWSNPQIMKDSEVCSDCSIILYDGQNLTFSVSGFSLYETRETPSSQSPSGGGGGGSSGCLTTWQCTEWSSCIDGNQTRICTKVNPVCAVGVKPEESQQCTISSEETTEEETTTGETSEARPGILAAVIGNRTVQVTGALIFIAIIIVIYLVMRIKSSQRIEPKQIKVKTKKISRNK